MDATTMIADMAKSARAASRSLASLSSVEKSAGLLAVAAAIRGSSQDILSANAQDVEAGTSRGLSPALLDRLLLEDRKSVV